MEYFSILEFLLVYNVASGGHVFDLTHAYNNVTVYWPSEQRYRFMLNNIDRYDDNATGEYYEGNRFCTAEHGGTHMDAPLHFNKNGRSISDIPVEELLGEAFVVDVSNDVKSDVDFLIETRHVQRAEEIQGTIPVNAILMLYTGWSNKWKNLVEYLGTNTTNTSILHFPGLHHEAAEWIVNYRKVRAIGIDTASIDYGQSKHYKSHNILMRAGIPVLENVNAIHQILVKNVTIYALPMKIERGSGAPVRIIAVENPTSGDRNLRTNAMMLGVIFCFSLFKLFE